MGSVMMVRVVCSVLFAGVLFILVERRRARMNVIGLSRRGQSGGAN